MKKHLVILIIILLITILVLSGCVLSTFEDEPVKIAMNVWPGYAYVFIAEEKGFFEKNGVDVELILTEEYSEAQDLYVSGKADGIFEVYADDILHNSERIATKVVYVIDYSESGDVIVGKAEFGSLAGLKGKKIGTEGINTFSHLFILTALKDAGVEEWDILLDIVPAHDILAALESGQIDAGHTWEPTKSAALEKGYVILGTAGDTPGIISDVLAFDSQIIKQRPEDIQAIIRSLSEAKDFLDNNRQEALEIMANAEGMSIEEMDEGTNGVHILSLQENIAAMKQSKDMTSLYTSGEAIINFYLHRGQLFHKPDLNDIIEPRFINNIAGAE